jgi:hypothetical protein
VFLTKWLMVIFGSLAALYAIGFMFIYVNGDLIERYLSLRQNRKQWKRKDEDNMLPELELIGEAIDNLFDKVMDNEELNEIEGQVVQLFKVEPIRNEFEQQVLDQFQEQDDFIYDYNSRYFFNISEKIKVLAKLKARSLEQEGIEEI